MTASTKYVRYSRPSYWPNAGRIGRAIAYLSVPASTLTAGGGILTNVNVLTSVYIVAIIGLVGVLRGAQVQPNLVSVSYFLMTWYCVLLGIELIHGGPLRYPLLRGTNYLTDYFPLVALPFFVIGLQEVKAELRIFERMMLLTVLFAAGLSLYQSFVLGVLRPPGFSFNPIPFALIVLMWSLFLFSGALQTQKIDWTRFSVALVGLVPILLSGSKIVWFCAASGYFILFFLWAWTGRRWMILGTVLVSMVPFAWLLLRVEIVRNRLAEFTGDFGAFLASGDTSGGTFGLRYGAIISGFLAFLERPFLGYGLAQVKTAALEHRPPTFSSFAGLPQLHNEYVTHLVAFGILGLLFIVSLFVMFMFVAARRKDVAIRRFGLVAGALFLAYMTVEVVFTHSEVYGLVFLLLGLVLLSPEKKRENQVAQD